MNKRVQIVRAIAIIAVIIIHTCPAGILGIYIRVGVNFAVSVFFFLSGYLTKINIEKSFIKQES